ncbi:CHR12, partial [Symbiodinium sp. KB8]
MVDRREANRGAASKSDFETIFGPTRTRNPDGCVGGWDVGTLSLCHCRGNEQLTVDFWFQEPNDHHLASCVFAIQACEGTAAGVALCAELGKRLQRPGAAELDQAFGGVDELLERGQLTAAAGMSLGRRAAGARGRLLALAGMRRKPTSQLAHAAGPITEQGSWRLHEPLLELQPSLGWVHTTEVLQGQLAFSSSGRWRGLARRASRRELSDALLNEDEEVSSQSIVSWLAFNMQADTSGLSLGVPGRCAAFGASWAMDSVAGGSALEQRLLPVFREHDRSQHAERMALLSVAASAASQNQRSRPDLQERAADREFTFGSVRLYATHTLCISCLAVCCQFHRLFPRVSLKVEMDTWDETLRWSCRKARTEPRCGLEQLVAEITSWHQRRLGLEVLGSEWWTLWLDGEDDDVGWHWDADYEARERGDVQHPLLGTVTYLEAGGSVAPTAVLEDCFETELLAGKGTVVARAHLSLPVPGKHICFDGRLLHAAPAQLREIFGTCASAELPKCSRPLHHGPLAAMPAKGTKKKRGAGNAVWALAAVTTLAATAAVASVRLQLYSATAADETPQPIRPRRRKKGQDKGTTVSRSKEVPHRQPDVQADEEPHIQVQAQAKHEISQREDPADEWTTRCKSPQATPKLQHISWQGEPTWIYCCGQWQECLCGGRVKWGNEGKWQLIEMPEGQSIQKVMCSIDKLGDLIPGDGGKHCQCEVTPGTSFYRRLNPLLMPEQLAESTGSRLIGSC